MTLNFGSSILRCIKEDDAKDGIRFTISEVARHKVLQRLLMLKHKQYEKEFCQGLHEKKKNTKLTSTWRKKKAKNANGSQQSLYRGDV